MYTIHWITITDQVGQQLGLLPRLTGKGAFKSVYDVMNNWGANHGAITYGHIGADLIYSSFNVTYSVEYT